MKTLKWETKKVKVKDLIQLEINPRKISEEKKQKLIQSLEKFNLVEIPAVNTDFKIIGGNQRVAAEQMKRRCRMIELDPKYCQVIIDRMRKLNPEIKIVKNKKTL